MSEPIIKFKTSDYSCEIEAVKVVKETGHYITYLTKWFGAECESKSRKDCREQFHDSWDAAKDFLVKREEENVQSARLSLERAKDKLGNVKGMKPPKEAA